MRLPVLLALLCALALPRAASAGTIFTDDFESTAIDDAWRVVQEISDGAWVTTQGNGIEIQRSGTVATSHSGNQHIELDSDWRRGGTGGRGRSNSAMTRTLTGLEAGEYRLDYFYRGRTQSDRDNTIGVYFDEGDLFSGLVDTANGVGSDGWVKYSVPLLVAENGSTRRLSFRAEGTQNRLGGLIDTVSLTRTGGGGVPEPGPLSLLALAAGALWRRGLTTAG